MEKDLAQLIKRVEACEVCRDHLPGKPRPVVQCRSAARLLIVGEAPGPQAHRTGIPWNDPSGQCLRTWMGISRKVFYEHSAIAILPMGFCYPGKRSFGDLPPRSECAPQWHDQLLQQMPAIELTLVVGQLAHDHYLPDRGTYGLTQTIRHWERFLPDFLPLPDPSPKNHLWVETNSWFEADVLPGLRKRVAKLLRINGGAS